MKLKAAPKPPGAGSSERRPGEPAADAPARRKAVPGDEQYHAIARRLVEHLKRSGVEKVVRRVSRSHELVAEE